MHDYLGWIPTITGHLSFSTIGTAKNPEKEFKFLRQIGDKTLYIVAERRRTTDAVFNLLGDFLNWTRSRDGYSVFVLFAQSNAETGYSELSGPCLELSLETYKNLEPDLHKIEAETDTKRQQELFTAAAKEFLTEAALRPCAYSAVTICRDGKTRISFIHDGQVSDLVERRNASQVFFFLRDVTHRHQHHAPSSDTILDVMPKGSNDHSWKRETLYSLYRWVIHRKRDKSIEQLINCKGVLAYAEAFEAVHCAKDQTSVPIEDRIPKYNHETTLASVEAQIDALREVGKKRSFTTLFFSRMLPFFAVLLSLLIPIYTVGTHDNPSAQQRIVASAADWASANILTTIGGLLLVSLIVAVSSKIQNAYRRSNFMLDLLRTTLAVFPKKRSLVFALILVILSLLGVSIFILSSLLENVASEWSGWSRV